MSVYIPRDASICNTILVKYAWLAVLNSRPMSRRIESKYLGSLIDNSTHCACTYVFETSNIMNCIRSISKLLNVCRKYQFKILLHCNLHARQIRDVNFQHCITVHFLGVRIARLFSWARLWQQITFSISCRMFSNFWNTSWFLCAKLNLSEI